MNSIVCILVLYNPDLHLLSKVVSSVSTQIDFLYIADNSSTSNLEIELMLERLNVKYVYNFIGTNVGIAEAQNLGLKYIFDHIPECTSVFYLDQDSICPNDLINSLNDQLKILLERNIYVGAVGPRVINRQTNMPYKALFNKGSYYSIELTEVRELISSASLIPISVFHDVGLMDSKLFIDGVDHEWCWRASHIKQYRFFICEKIHLSHQLGEGDKKFLLRKIAIPTPFRTYYQFRNYFLLIRRNYVPLYWKLTNGIKYFIKIFYYPLFLNNKKKYTIHMLKGIRDGIFSR